jgi:hypothetical protein
MGPWGLPYGVIVMTDGFVRHAPVYEGQDPQFGYVQVRTATVREALAVAHLEARRDPWGQAMVFRIDGTEARPVATILTGRRS